MPVARSSYWIDCVDKMSELEDLYGFDYVVGYYLRSRWYSKEVSRGGHKGKPTQIGISAKIPDSDPETEWMTAGQVNFGIVTEELTALARNLEKDLMETRHKLFKDALVLDWREIDEAYQVDMESEFSDVEDIFEVLRPKTPEWVE